MRISLIALMVLAGASGAAQADAPLISLVPAPRPSALMTGHRDVTLASLSLAHPVTAPVQMASAALPAPLSLPPVPDATAPIILPQGAVAPGLRPKLRPSEEAALAGSALAPASTIRPQLRPATAPVRVAAAAPVAQAAAAPVADTAAEPVEPAGGKPNLLQRIAFFAAPPGAGLTRSGKGSICGDAEIQGEAIAPVTSRVRGCGIAAAVKVTSVAGVRLSVPATVECPTAIALKKWVTTGLKPAVGNEGGGVKSLTVFDSYTCRSRDNIKGAVLSLHSQGKAIDIGGFTLANGQSVMVEKGWRSAAQGPILKAAYHKACGIFGTTLSPDGDKYHQTHMHFDTAHYNYGAYCH